MSITSYTYLRYGDVRVFFNGLPKDAVSFEGNGIINIRVPFVDSDVVITAPEGVIIKSYAESNGEDDGKINLALMQGESYWVQNLSTGEIRAMSSDEIAKACQIPKR